MSVDHPLKRNKDLEDSDGFVHVADGESPSERHDLLKTPTTPAGWYELFDKDCVQQRPGDDMLFYVRQQCESLPAEDRVLVRRWTATNKLTLDSPEKIDWESTYYLNFIVNHLSYTLEFKVFRKPAAAAASTGRSGPFPNANNASNRPKAHVLRRSSKPIFAAPNHVRLDMKKSEQTVEYTFPEVFFTIHDHDIADESNLLAGDDEYMAINLTASGQFLGRPVESVELFRGAASQKVVWQAYSSTQQQQQGRGPAASLASFARLGSTRRPKNSTGEYLTLRGPKGKGRAQMSVTTPEAIDKLRGDHKSSSSSSSSSLAKPFAGLLGKSSSSSSSVSKTQHLYCSLVFCALPWEVIVADLTTHCLSTSSANAQKK